MKKKHNGTQIVAKLRQADVLIGQGRPAASSSGREACQAIGACCSPDRSR
ncbi:MAG: hypothetical protein ACYTAS_01225 [Planctomycetota bacterium]|jgi:hypothetical protein